MADFASRVQQWQRIMGSAPLPSREGIFRRACADLMKIAGATAESADALHEIAVAHDIPIELVQEGIAHATRITAPTNGHGQHAAAAVASIPVIRPFPIVRELLPRRPWMIPGLLLRRQVTLMVAPPGIGKSLLTLQLAMLATSGLEHWANWRPRGRFRVLVINVEEDEDEMRRRLVAAAGVMQLDHDLLGGIYLAQTSSIVVARADNKTKTVVATPMLEQIVQTIIEQQIDIVIVDPFAETFAGDENSNSELKWAAVLWREVARRTNCAVFLVHHAKKYAGHMAGDPDAGRGGGALTGVARIVATLFNMTEPEAETLKIKPTDRLRYIRFDDAKANQNLLSPSARWFEKISISLGNEGDGEPADEVGVLVPWKAPDLFADLSLDVINRIFDEIELGERDDNGAPTGDPYGARVSPRWVGRVVQKLANVDEKTAKAILARWFESGVLATDQRKTSTSNGRLRECVVVMARPGEAL